MLTATLSPEFIQANFYVYFQYAGIALVVLAFGCWVRRK
jgi:hypothetical protein